MSLKLASNNIPPMEAGSYPARVLSVVELGKQSQLPWQGQERPPAKQVLVTYELLDEYLADENGENNLEKPRVISEKFNVHPLTSERATSTKRYFALDPVNIYEGDLAQCVDTPTMVTIVQNPQKATGRIFNNVAGLSPMRQKDASNAKALVNTPYVFDLDEPNMVVWGAIHDWVRNIIKGNLDYQGSVLQSMIEEGAALKDEDAPF